MSNRDWPAGNPAAMRRVEHALATVRVGEEIRRLREGSPMTLRAFAALLGLSAPFMSDVEHGRRSLSHDKLPAAAKLLGTTAKRLAEVAGVCTHCMGSGYAPLASQARRPGR